MISCQVTSVKSANANNKADSLNLEASANNTDIDAKPPLHKAVKEDDIEEVKNLILNSGVGINSQDSFGNTSLHLAVWEQKIAIVRWLLENKADPNLRNLYYREFRDHYHIKVRYTPLHLAVDRSNSDIVQFLLRYSADPNYKDENTNTPLHLAVRKRHADILIIKNLLKYGADPNLRNKFKDTAITLAINKAIPNLTILEMLLKKKINLNSKSKYQGRPLDKAIEKGNMPFVKLLLKYKADPNIALCSAAKKGNVDYINVLLEYGADVNCRDEYQNTPLHKAVGYGNVDCVHVLLEHGADVNCRDTYQNTPLREAVICRNVDCVHVLLEHGADVNCRDTYQNTPLHKAVMCSNVDCVHVLLEHGADVNCRDTYYNKTPLDLILYDSSNTNITDAIKIAFIKRKAVNISQKNIDKMLDKAISKVRLSIITAFLEHRCKAEELENHKNRFLIKAMEKLTLKSSQINRQELKGVPLLITYLLQSNADPNTINFRYYEANCPYEKYDPSIFNLFYKYHYAQNIINGYIRRYEDEQNVYIPKDLVAPIREYAYGWPKKLKPENLAIVKNILLTISSLAVSKIMPS
ncbi:MAG: ankyrin repeat domain-containing protein [Bacteroidota bacterium]